MSCVFLLILTVTMTRGGLSTLASTHRAEERSRQAAAYIAEHPENRFLSLENQTESLWSGGRSAETAVSVRGAAGLWPETRARVLGEAGSVTRLLAEQPEIRLLTTSGYKLSPLINEVKKKAAALGWTASGEKTEALEAARTDVWTVSVLPEAAPAPAEGAATTD